MGDQNQAGPQVHAETPVEEEHYEGTPEELTGFKPGPVWFDRKKLMIVISGVFVCVVMAGMIFSLSNTKKKQAADENNSGYAARPPSDFLRRELDRAQSNPVAGEIETENGSDIEAFTPAEDTLPEVTVVDNRPVEQVRYREPPPPPITEGGGGSPPPPTYPRSPLVPAIEGSLFGAPAAASPQTGQTPPQSPYPPALQYPQYPGVQGPNTAQNNPNDKNTFYSSASGGSLSGTFLGDDLLWIGTIIPAVLETSVNTDLPGNVIARVTENIYDTRTGKKLLVPQGTILVAKYNSSVSYAQRRIQIVWDLLIRPDGYQLELEDMNGVDSKGMAGLKAQYKENYFEYIKAVGLITMFSLANAKMAEEAARYGSEGMAAGVVSANAEFMSETGGNIVSRAMNIQPTLLLRNGEKVNIMLNKNLYLPPVEDNPVMEKYILK